MESKIKYCFICGYDLSEKTGVIEKFSICDCCLFQYGIDDVLYGKSGLMQFRFEWIQKGFPFEGKLINNSNWNLDILRQQILNTTKINIFQYPIKHLIMDNIDWEPFNIDIDKSWKFH